MFFHIWWMGYFCVWKEFLRYKLSSAQCSCTIYRNQDAWRIPKIYSSYWKKQHNSVLLHWLPLFHTLLYDPSILRRHIQIESCSISVWVCIIWFHGTSSSFSLAVTNLSSCFFHICLPEQWFNKDGAGVLSSTNWSHFLWMRTHPKVGLQHHMLVLPWMFWDIP